MKKILLFIVWFFLIFSFPSVEASNYKWDCWDFQSWDLKTSLEDCFKNSKLVKSDDLKVDWSGFQEKINNWRKWLSLIFLIFWVFGLVYASFLMVISAWNEEWINKAIKIIKWDLIWCLLLIFITTIITFVISLAYNF